MRLLFVEDSYDDVLLATLALERAGLDFQCETVRTARDLVEALQRGAWCAVVSDYNVPGFGGAHALKIVRAHDPELPFILFSATIGEERAVEMIRAGVNDYVMKNNAARLAVAIKREVREANARRERRKLEETLRRAEDRYRQTFEKAPTGVVNIDRNGVVINANEQFCAMFGRSCEAIVGRSFAELVDADDLAPLRALRDEVLSDDGQCTRAEVRYRRADGSVRTANVTLSCVRAPNDPGDFTVIAMVDDITERKRVEENLLSHKEQLAEAQAIARIGSWSMDIATGIYTISDQLCSLYGFSPGAAPAIEQIYARIHPDDRARVREAEVLARETFEPFSVRFRIVREDGALRTFDSSLRCVLDPAGRPLQIFGVVQDITERLAGEEDLRQRAVQQAAVANLGQLALRGTALEEVLWEATALVCAALDVEFCEILRKKNGHFVLVEGAGWEEGIVGREKVGARTQAAFTLAAGYPIVAENVAAEERFVASDLMLRHGITSGVTVAISSSDGEPWGVLGAHSRRPRTYTTNDVDFLRVMAAVLGQAIERGRADAELRARAAQQSAIAELGRLTLTSLTDEALHRACDLVISALTVDQSTFAAVDGDRVRYRAGRWDIETLPNEVPLSMETQAGRTILTGAPVIISDYKRERDLATAVCASASGITSGISVPVASASRTYGVLGAFSRAPRQFSESDRDFMQSLANILAETMERDEARSALVESEERYRTVVEGASEIIFTLDLDATIVSLNPAFETITGWPAADWIGRPFTDLITPADRKRLRRMFGSMKANFDPVTLETSIVGNGGTVLLETAAFARVRDGKIVGVYGFSRDITEARRIESERQQLTRSLQLILESTIEGIYTMDVSGRCTLINSAAARMLGRERDELLGCNMHEIVHGQRADGSLFADHECPIRQVLQTSEPCSVVNDVFWQSDGNAVPVDYSAAPIIDNGVAVGAVISFTDITERRKLETKLEQANRLSSLGRLAATVAHEFNNVLMGIAPFVEIIRRDPARSDSALDQISRSVNRGKRITQDILRFTQPAEPQRVVFDVEPWLENVAFEARSLLPPGYQVELAIENPNLVVEADAAQLHQIMLNLVINARDAMPGGGVLTIFARREPADARFEFGVVERPESFIHFGVQDTGVGIPHDALQHIFEPLFTTKKNGTGLGLTVTHQVVRHHHGEIFVESTAGEGTTFHIFIPLPDGVADAATTPETIEEVALLESTQTRRVLLVEDDPIVAEGLLALLMFEGFEVDVVTTGLDAITAVLRKRPDVVLLDVGLPDLEGTKVYRRIAEIDSTLPVIFSTGHADRARLDEFLGARNVACLLKPYDSDVLLATIASVFRS